ncbi:hypothetical protein GF420_08385 [candidate division GN15 bacterium]|nr:hypothetical protein [candidate division GN15 bacterium]
MRSFAIRLLVLALPVLLIAGCSQEKQVKTTIKDGRVNRDKRSLVGIDSMHVYATAHVQGQQNGDVSGGIQDYLIQRFDSAGFGITRTPFNFGAGYVSVWVDGYPVYEDADSVNPQVFFSALLQVERYTQIRHQKELTEEEPKLTLATTWKKFGTGSCPHDSLLPMANRLIGHWLDTLQIEHARSDPAQ